MIIYQRTRIAAFARPSAHAYLSPSFISSRITAEQLVAGIGVQEWSVVAVDVFQAGPVAAEVFSAGAETAQVFNAGPVAGEVAK